MILTDINIALRRSSCKPSNFLCILTRTDFCQEMLLKIPNSINIKKKSSTGERLFRFTRTDRQMGTLD